MGDPQGFRRKRWHERVIEPEHQGDPADNLIAIGDPVEGPDAVSRLLERRQVWGGNVEFLQERPWIVAAKDEAGFGWQCGRGALTEDDR